MIRGLRPRSSFTGSSTWRRTSVRPFSKRTRSTRKFEPKSTLGLIRKHFGAIPRPTRKLEATYTVEPTQDGARFVTLRRVGDVAAAGLIYHVPAGSHADFAAVLLNNESWRDELAQVPFERRLLLLPKCLRVEEHCPAPFDQFGMLCKECGLCSIEDLAKEAEHLGYAVLIAEGSAIVRAMRAGVATAVQSSTSVGTMPRRT